MIVSEKYQIVVIRNFGLSSEVGSCYNEWHTKSSFGIGQVASEAVANHRTITAFSSQDKMLKLFESKELHSSAHLVHGRLISGMVGSSSTMAG